MISAIVLYLILDPGFVFELVILHGSYISKEVIHSDKMPLFLTHRNFRITLPSCMGLLFRIDTGQKNMEEREKQFLLAVFNKKQLKILKINTHKSHRVNHH